MTISGNFALIDGVATYADATSVIGAQFLTLDGNYPSASGLLPPNVLATCISTSPDALWEQVPTWPNYVVKSKSDYCIRQQRVDGAWDIVSYNPPCDDAAKAVSSAVVNGGPVYIPSGLVPIAAPIELGNVNFRAPYIIGAGTENTVLQRTNADGPIFQITTPGNFSRGVFRDFTAYGQLLYAPSLSSEKHEQTLFGRLRLVSNAASQTALDLQANFNLSRFQDVKFEGYLKALRASSVGSGWGGMIFDNCKVTGCSYGLQFSNCGYNYVRGLACDSVASWAIYSQSPGNRFQNITIEQKQFSNNPCVVLSGLASGYAYGAYNNSVEYVTLPQPITDGATSMWFTAGASGNRAHYICPSRGIIKIDAGCVSNDIIAIVDKDDPVIGSAHPGAAVLNNGGLTNTIKIIYTNGGKNGPPTSTWQNY